jgi:hypothetical protein
LVEPQYVEWLAHLQLDLNTASESSLLRVEIEFDLVTLRFDTLYFRKTKFRRCLSGTDDAR